MTTRIDARFAQLKREGRAAFVTFVRAYEEPTLRQVYGDEYADYCATTPRWFPLFWR